MRPTSVPRSRSWRALSRTMVALCALVMLGWVGSWFWRLTWRQPKVMFDAWGGQLNLSIPGAYPPGWPSKDRLVFYYKGSAVELFVERDTYFRVFAGFPGGRSVGDLSFVCGHIPFWVLFLATFIPTVLVRRATVRRRVPGTCVYCEYDLTGNLSGVCPECGSPTAVAPQQGARPSPIEKLLAGGDGNSGAVLRRAQDADPPQARFEEGGADDER